MPKRISARLWWLGWLGLLPPGPGPLAWNRVLVLFFFAPLLEDAVRFARRRRAQRARRPHVEAPLPRSAGGPVRFWLRFVVSSTLASFHRAGLRQMVRQLRGDAAARDRAGDPGPAPETYAQKVEYTLPFRGEWLVLNGGVTPETSHSWEIVSQRYAYDVVIADGAGRRERGEGTRPEDFLCYGEPVLAPADGEVTAVVEGVRDAPRPGTGWLDWRTPQLGGNSVTLRHAPDEYSYLAHLAPGSVRVQPGQRVRRGEEVGRCGNSGHSTEPHLHFQVQDHADFFLAVGLPVRFSGVAADGEAAPDALYLSAGMRVRPAAGEP